MEQAPDNPDQIYLGVPVDSPFVMPRHLRSRWQVITAVLFMALGGVAVPLALVLTSNQLGNTDIFGFWMLGLAAWLMVTGFVYLLFPKNFWIAGAIGFSVAPLAIVLLIALFWILLFMSAIGKRHHQAYVANGISQIVPARQMDELYDDCRHYITYGSDGEALFNSVAYFGDRCVLTMQVPVEIESKTSGRLIGEPTFQLLEVRAVQISPSGQVSASFSADRKFGALEWKQVYEAQGDFDRIGIDVNPSPVPGFQTFAKKSRRSD